MSIKITKEDIGKSFTCKIYDTNITDGKIQFEKDNFYLCQNHKNGDSCKDKLGYIYSWYIGDSSNLSNFGVFDLKFNNEVDNKVNTTPKFSVGSSVTFKDVNDLPNYIYIFGGHNDVLPNTVAVIDSINNYYNEYKCYSISVTFVNKYGDTRSYTMLEFEFLEYDNTKILNIYNNQLIEFGSLKYSAVINTNNCYLNGDNCNNDRVFKVLGLDKIHVCLKVIGYYDDGVFPTCRTSDDLVKLINFLYTKLYDNIRYNNIEKTVSNTKILNKVYPRIYIKPETVCVDSKEIVILKLPTSKKVIKIDFYDKIS